MANNFKFKKELFNYKNEYIQNNKYLKYRPIDLEEFYRLIFERDGKLPFQKEGKQEYKNLKYNSIVVALDDDDKASNFIVNDDLKVLEKIRGQKFVISSPITYVGRNRNANNSRFIYGLAFDIDVVKEPQIRDIFYQISINYIPTPNIIVNSGNGVHLYYLFECPFPLFRFTKIILKELKYHLTNRLWNVWSSGTRNRQFQPIFQGFRLPETQTKFGELVSAFATDAGYHTIEKLNLYIQDPKLRIRPNEMEFLNKISIAKSKYTLAEAKKLFPQWYELRIVKGQKKGTWTTSPKLYDWWLNKIKTDQKVSEGHRYFCVMILAIYAVKSGINFERLKADAYDLIDFLDEKTSEADNHFTKKDVDDALVAFKECYRTFPVKDIELLSGLSVPKNKRNKQTRKNHLEIARVIQLIRDKQNQTNWRKNSGRKSKQAQILEWQANNPDGTQYRCQKDTKLSKNTVKKWWNS